METRRSVRARYSASGLKAALMNAVQGEGCEIVEQSATCIPSLSDQPYGMIGTLPIDALSIALALVRSERAVASLPDTSLGIVVTSSREGR